MFPTVRRISGRSTNSSTRRSSSRIATRVSRWLPAIRISRFNFAYLCPGRCHGGGILPVRLAGPELVNLDERQLLRRNAERRSEYFRRLDRAVAAGGNREGHGIRRKDRQLVHQRTNVYFPDCGLRSAGFGSSGSPPLTPHHNTV